MNAARSVHKWIKNIINWWKEIEISDMIKHKQEFDLAGDNQQIRIISGRTSWQTKINETKQNIFLQTTEPGSVGIYDKSNRQRLLYY
jgi:hypothetical protein